MRSHHSILKLLERNAHKKILLLIEAKISQQQKVCESVHELTHPNREASVVQQLLEDKTRWSSVLSTVHAAVPNQCLQWLSTGVWHLNPAKLQGLLPLQLESEGPRGVKVWHPIVCDTSMLCQDKAEQTTRMNHKGHR